MVTKGYKKTFFNKRTLYLLVNFRIEGYPIASLAALFHCDKRSVRKQCDRYSVVPIEKLFFVKGNPALPFSVPLESDPPRREWFIENGARVNAGHSYKDYLVCSPSLKKHPVV